MRLQTRKRANINFRASCIGLRLRSITVSGRGQFAVMWSVGRAWQWRAADNESGLHHVLATSFFARFSDCFMAPNLSRSVVLFGVLSRGG